MKFTMFEKETKDEKYHLAPYKTVNFKTDEKREKCGYFEINTNSMWF